MFLNFSLAAALFLFLSVFIPSAEASVSCEALSPRHLRLASFNIQTNQSIFQVSPWGLRKKLIADFIRAGNYEVFGVQEILDPMIQDLLAELPNYARTGVGRTDGAQGGEYTAIFYRKDRMNLLASETFWLSETPQIPGRRGWDAQDIRIATWASFEDLLTGSIFYVFNTHLDHRGKKAQEQSAILLAEEARRISNGYPVITMGDFNVKEKSKVYNLFLERSGYSDTMSLALQHQGPKWSHSFFGMFRAKIDFIFVSSDIKVCQHIITPEAKSGPRRSDHLPVSVVLEL